MKCKNIYVFVCKLLRRDSRRGRNQRVCNQNSVPDELVNEKEKYKNIADEMDQAFSELSGF